MGKIARVSGVRGLGEREKRQDRFKNLGLRVISFIEGDLSGPFQRGSRGFHPGMNKFGKRYGPRRWSRTRLAAKVASGLLNPFRRRTKHWPIERVGAWQVGVRKLRCKAVHELVFNRVHAKLGD